MQNEKLAVIDASAFIFRAFYSTPPMQTSFGRPINAVYGFFGMIFNTLRQTRPKYIIFAMDTKGKTFRDELYNQYKANRIACPPDLIPQFEIITEGLCASNLANIAIEGLEADDIIASICKNANFAGLTKLICSKDKDLMQLITNPNVLQYDFKTNQYIDAKAVVEKFGVEPKYIADYLALVGDSSDNIPGAKNIGPKKACEIINKLGSIENIYRSIENNEQIIDAKIIALLQESKSNVLLSKQLTTLTGDDINLQLQNQYLTETINTAALEAFFAKYELKSLRTKLAEKWLTESWINKSPATLQPSQTTQDSLF